jgi:hypothetical protein
MSYSAKVMAILNFFTRFFRTFVQEISKFQKWYALLQPKPKLCPKFQPSISKAAEKSSRQMFVKGGGGGNGA